MFQRLKRALTSSYVGAIALGWTFAQGIWHFASVFSAPVAGWLTRKEYRGFIGHAPVGDFTLRDSLPELAKSVSLFLVGYLLLRWLYFGPPEKQQAPEIASDHSGGPQN
jgi:hypothetical protein